MKKTKLLTPVLALATLGSVAPAIALVTSCNKGSSQEIELDSSTAKEQTTDDNKTITTYCFNLKDKLNTNSNAETEEIEVKTEDVETPDGVTIEISNLKYDATTGKFYVTITTCKEDGALNDQETISFSLNFRCVGSVSREKRWERKISHFIIKHNASIIWSGHFNDTDTSKRIMNDKETELGVTQNKNVVFKINPSENWVSSGAVSEDDYDLNKLNCYVYQDLDANHFMPTITLPDHSESLQMKLVASATSDEQYLSVTIPYTITELAEFGSKARFALVFTYDGDTVFQTIGGFSIQYVETVETSHARLLTSREQHYYTAEDLGYEKGSNILSFNITDDVSSLTADDFTVATKNERIKFGEKYMFTYKGELRSYNILTVAYSIDSQTSNPTPRPETSNIYNVEIELSCTKESAEWSQTFKGYSFYKGSSRFEEGKLIYADETTLQSIEYKANSKIDFTDVLRTCQPFDLTQFLYFYSYAVIDEEKSASTAEFEITSLGWNVESSEHYSVASLDATKIDAGSHTVKIYVYAISEEAAYAYCLNIGSVEFAA